MIVGKTVTGPSRHRFSKTYLTVTVKYVFESTTEPIAPTRSSYEYFYTFVNRHAANILLVFGHETKHEAIAEGQAMIFRSSRELFRLYLFNSKPEVGSLK